MVSPTPAPDLLIGALLRGENAPWASVATREQQRELLTRIEYHGVLARVHERCSTDPECPDALRSAIASRAHRAAAIAAGRYAETRRVVDALVAAGVRPLLMKGAALAHTHYSSPALRHSLDSDLFVGEASYNLALEVLLAHGYERRYRLTSDMHPEIGQASCVRSDAFDTLHFMDVHAKISGALVYADLVSFEEAVAKSVPLTALGEHARCLGPVHALLLACAHLSQSTQSDRLVWLSDIHLLMERFSDDEFDEFARLALSRRVRGVCAKALLDSHAWFPLSRVDQIRKDLASPRASDALELSRLIISPNPRLWQEPFVDMASHKGWRSRFRVARAYLFPPASYIRERYSLNSAAALPVYYVLRLGRILTTPFHERHSGGSSDATQPKISK